ncbi:MAG: sodium:calcium antiporter [Halobacteriovoraceae bacterium]|nr:sodium:calcium antiporter [Halobacteriovoraceae bacterium]MCB9095102.1 sodium:calcium antiporter [Halobacteriovoraceae bacterium]
MLIEIILYFILSVGLLLYGSTLALDSAETLGKAFRLPPVIVGVLFIGFGTSLPELFVSQLACLEGKPLVSLGNIVGSNISNTALILGIVCFLVEIKATDKSQKMQLYFHLIATALFTGIYFVFKRISWEALILLGLFFVFYLYYILVHDKFDLEDDESSNPRNNLWHAIKFSLSIGFMYFGGKYLIQSTVSMGKYFEMPEYIISAIALALGTSAPELFTALIACYKKRDVNLILGNIIGSNIFNITLILGSTGIYQYSLEGINIQYEISILNIFAVYFIAQLILLKGILGKRTGLLFLITYGLVVQYWIQS